MSTIIPPNSALSATKTTAEQLQALLQVAAIAPLQDLGWIRVTGEDRVRWLNGMVTNSVQQLTPGTGNYNFILNVQGRIQGDANIFLPAEPNPSYILIQTAAKAVETLITLLDRFIIMDDVELTDISPTRSGLLVAGPHAEAVLSQIGIRLPNLAELSLVAVSYNSADLTVIHSHSPLVPRYELWSDAGTITAISQMLISGGAAAVEDETLTQLRILEGTPLYGTDVQDKVLPQETGQTRALHFAKGCYLGQEIVERIRSRGNVHRAFTAFILAGSPAAPGTPIESESKPAGEITSTAKILLPGAPEPVQLALGYLRRETIDRNSPLTYPGGTATVGSIPFKTPIG